MSDLPYFPFYPKDFLSDSKTALMDTVEVGAYCLLLFYAWDNFPRGSVPDNDEKLARLTRLSLEEFQKRKVAILAPFELRNEFLYQKRLEEEAIKAEEKSAKAKKSADAKWEKFHAAKQMESNCTANAMRTHSDGNANASAVAERTVCYSDSESESDIYTEHQSHSSNGVDLLGLGLEEERAQIKIRCSPEKKKPGRKPESYEQLREFIVNELELPEDDAGALWDKWNGNNFTNAGKPIGNWQATASGWKRQNIFSQVWLQ